MGDWAETCAITRTAIGLGRPAVAVLFYDDPRQNKASKNYMQPYIYDDDQRVVQAHGAMRDNYCTREAMSTMFNAKRYHDEALRNEDQEREFYERLKAHGNLGGLNEHIEQAIQRYATRADDTDPALHFVVYRGWYNDYGGINDESGATIFEGTDYLRYTNFFLHREVADEITRLKGANTNTDFVDAVLTTATYARVELFDQWPPGEQYATLESLKMQRWVRGMAHKMWQVQWDKEQAYIRERREAKKARG